jgi:hypothetical protein
MKERMATTLGLLSLSLMLIAMVTPVRADATHAAWVEPAYAGIDPALGSASIVGYLTGTNWNFSFSWTNDQGVPINITDVRVYFDWGKNYTSSYSVINQIMPGITQTFAVYNVTPPITEAPELWAHNYYVYLDHVNDTATPYRTWNPIYMTSGSNFAVLSADHLECLRLWRRLNGVNWHGISSMSTSAAYSPTSITKVTVMIEKAHAKYDLGYSILQAKVFGQAKTYLTDADTMYSQALDIWDERGTAYEDADLNNTIAQTNLYNAQADAERKTGDAALVNAYGTLLFGLGWVFIGLGVVVYGMKKPKAAPPPT